MYLATTEAPKTRNVATFTESESDAKSESALRQTCYYVAFKLQYPFMTELTHYLTADGHDPFQAWLDATKRKDRHAAMRVLTRLNRLAAGNVGDAKAVGDGVMELRIDYGPGYRVYYAKIGQRLVMLLIGGSKKRQQADIEQAKAFLVDHRRRTKE